MKSTLWILPILSTAVSCTTGPGPPDASPQEILSHEYRVEFTQLGPLFRFDSLEPAVAAYFGGILKDADGKVLWKAHTAGWAKTRVENGPAPTALAASVRHLADELARDLDREQGGKGGGNPGVAGSRRLPTTQQ